MTNVYKYMKNGEAGLESMQAKIFRTEIGSWSWEGCGRGNGHNNDTHG